MTTCVLLAAAIVSLNGDFSVADVEARAASAPFPEFSAPRAVTSGPHDHLLAN